MKIVKETALIAIMLMAGLQADAANEKENVEQVTQNVALTTDVDYIIASETPFGDEGIVNIVNTEHAVLILKDVKPSKAKRLLAAHVQIGGEKAVDGTNCQLKLYNRGSIIMPYANDLKPLTVYSEPNFEGEACSDFGFESDGGFMNTLTDEKLNNRIRSFKLKRGHMVTFSLRKGGRGYSRCFIAADEDLEVATLPAILDRSISSYRVFKWYDTGKPQLAAAGGDTGACSALNVTSTYSWNQGTNMLPDVECVSHHIYEDYPSPSGCGNVNYTCHMKTNNEPLNSSDDHPQDLETILNNWENLMRTGMRLCSPSSWDGSDYWNGTGFLKQFFDSIDARGWRCDILDMHCYWPESNFNNLKNWVNAVHRPIWISEWCWGASWNTNGAFANGVTENQVRDALKRICNNLNGMNYVERYFYWNGERDPSKIYKNGKLTPAGEMYAQLDGGVGYNGKYDYVPKAPKQRDPKDFTVVYDHESGTAYITWYEYNHEMNEYIHVECRKGSDQPWEVVRDVTGIENEGIRLENNLEAKHGWEFRINEKDANGRERTTKAVMAATGNFQGGDNINVDGQTMYIGGNMLLNGNFDMGTAEWKNGTGANIGAPWFEVVSVGGNEDNGAYLQCYGTGTSDSEQAVTMVLDVEPNTTYYLSADIASASGLSCVLTLSSSTGDSIAAVLGNSDAVWHTQFQTVNSGNFDRAILRLKTLQNSACFDHLLFCKLFDTKEAAIEDGFSYQLKRADAVNTHYRQGPELNMLSKLNTCVNEAKEYEDRGEALTFLTKSIDDALLAMTLLSPMSGLRKEATNVLIQYYLPGYEQLEEALKNADTLYTLSWTNIERPSDFLDLYYALKEAYDQYLDMATLDDKVQNPTFAGTEGWNFKTGTYQGGQQGIGSYDYRALWKLPVEGNENETMGISQVVSDLPHGLYAVECEATTWHYCLTDQHAFINSNYGKAVSSGLTADYLDLNPMGQAGRWETLTSSVVYVDEGGSATIGFEGSKQGAQDYSWREVGVKNSAGDNREGSWAATNFRLRYYPLYKAPVDESRWGVCCLPRAVSETPFVHFYQIAAITSDYTTICLEPVAETQPGVPFLFKADVNSMTGETDMAALPEYGETVDKTTDGPGNLRGYFKTSARVPVGYYVLSNGKWTKVTDSSNRPRIQNFSAAMRPLNDKLSQHIAVVDSWDGPTLPIEGITQEEIAEGITSHLSPLTSNLSPVYDLQGRRVDHSPLKKGIYIINHKKHIVK